MTTRGAAALLCSHCPPGGPVACRESYPYFACVPPPTARPAHRASDRPAPGRRGGAARPRGSPCVPPEPRAASGNPKKKKTKFGGQYRGGVCSFYRHPCLSLRGCPRALPRRPPCSPYRQASPVRRVGLHAYPPPPTVGGAHASVYVALCHIPARLAPWYNQRLRRTDTCNRKAQPFVATTSGLRSNT